MNTNEKIQKFLKYLERQRITPYIKKNIKEYYKNLFEEEIKKDGKMKCLTG